jgi:monoamine oxidase
MTDPALVLARMQLMVDENGNDLTSEYLRILIDRGLPPAREPRNILIVGAGIAGLVAGKLLKDAGHTITILEANANRAGGRIKTWKGPEHFNDPKQYAEAGAMRIPDFHPLTLALIDKLGLARQLFYNVDVEPPAAPPPVPPVVYRDPHDGRQLWPDAPPPPPFVPPKKRNRTYIRVNGMQVSRADYGDDPRPINIGFGIDRKQNVTVGKMINDALEIVRDYYSEVVNTATGERQNLPDRNAWINGWAKLIRDFDQYSMRRFFHEQARIPEAAIQAMGTIENLTARLPLSFMHSFVGRSVINPDVTYWEIVGGMQELTDALARELEENIVKDARMIEIQYFDPDRPDPYATNVGPEGPHVWVRTIREPHPGDDPRKPTPERTFDGNLAILTLPFSSLRFVATAPLFSYKKRRAIIELHYDAATKVVLEFSKRWWEFTEEDWERELTPEEFREFKEWMASNAGAAEHNFVGGGSVSDNPNRTMYYPSHKIDGSEGGVILASYSWADDARRWDSIPDENRYLYALKGLKELHGKWIARFYTGRGKTQAWSRDYYAFGEAAVFAPGQLTDLHPSVPLPEGPVHFAGEHTSLKHAWIEGAVESAIRAALEIHNR